LAHSYQTEEAVASLLHNENLRHSSRGVMWKLEQSDGHVWVRTVLLLAAYSLSVLLVFRLAFVLF
jgi:hypothetical protein